MRGPRFPKILETVLAVRSLDQSVLDAEMEMDESLSIPGMAEAMQLFQEAKASKTKVGIIDDPDADGKCAGVVVHEICNAMGLPNYVYVTGRQDGHGLTSGMIDKMVEEGVGLLVAVDKGTGLDSAPAIEMARQKGMKVVVLDHHPFDLDSRSNPDVLVNVQHPFSPEDFNVLCGTGVAYMLAYNLVSIGEISPEILDKVIPMVALATVADVMPLVSVNRPLVHRGLRKFRRHPGLDALMGKSMFIGRVPLASHIQFTGAPLINCAARMGRADLAFKILTESDSESVEQVASELRELNSQRQQLQARHEAEADALISEMDESWNVILLASKTWDRGIIGPAAGRKARQYGRATFLAHESDAGILYGSGRAGGGTSCGELVRILRDKHNIWKGDGHAEAAGFEAHSKNMEKIYGLLNEEAETLLAGKGLINRLNIDAEWGLPLLSELAELTSLEPTGKDMPAATLLTKNVLIEQIEPKEKITILKVSDGRSQTRLKSFKPINLVAGQRASMVYSVPGDGELLLEDYAAEGDNIQGV